MTWDELSISIMLSFLGYLLEGLTVSVMMGAVAPGAKARDGIFIAFVCEFYRLTTLGNGPGIAEIHYLHEKKVEPGSAGYLTFSVYDMDMPGSFWGRASFDTQLFGKKQKTMKPF